jgi:hypothetical protein
MLKYEQKNSHDMLDIEYTSLMCEIIDCCNTRSVMSNSGLCNIHRRQLCINCKNPQYNKPLNTLGFCDNCKSVCSMDKCSNEPCMLGTFGQCIDCNIANTAHFLVCINNGCTKETTKNNNHNMCDECNMENYSVCIEPKCNNYVSYYDVEHHYIFKCNIHK